MSSFQTFHGSLLDLWTFEATRDLGSRVKLLEIPDQARNDLAPRTRGVFYPDYLINMPVANLPITADHIYIIEVK